MLRGIIIMKCLREHLNIYYRVLRVTQSKAFLGARKRKGHFFDMPLILIAATLFFPCGSPVGAAPQATPAVTSTAKLTTAGPHLRQVNLETGKQWRKIGEDRKAGMLTSEQAKALLKKLSDIHNQKITFIRANAKLELTADQAAQLNQMLKANAQSVP